MKNNVDEVMRSLFKRSEKLDRSVVDDFVEHYERLDDLVGNAPECYFLIDFTKINFEYLGESIYALTGYHSDEIVHQGENPWFNLYPDKVKSVFATQLYPNMMGFLKDYSPEEIKHLTFQHTLPMRHKDGSEFWAIVQSQYLIVSDEKRPVLSFGRITKIVVPKIQEYISFGIHEVSKSASKLLFQKFYSIGQDSNHISEREKDILKQLVQGQSSKEIANELFISANTVNNHRRNLLSKLRLQNTADLVRYALTNALY